METRTLGEIAATVPTATRVFLRHRLDFCCGGRRTLAQACEQAGLDAAAIERELAAEIARPADVGAWEDRPTADLCEHIVRHYHEALRRDVPALIRAARRVEHVHAAKPDVPAGLADVLETFWEEMQDHMRKEEMILFPLLARDSSGAAMPVRVMEAEHDAHAERLAQIRALTGEMTPPGHACATWRALYDGLAAMERELMLHIHLENHVLFPRAFR